MSVSCTERCTWDACEVHLKSAASWRTYLRLSWTIQSLIWDIVKSKSLLRNRPYFKLHASNNKMLCLHPAFNELWYPWFRSLLCVGICWAISFRLICFLLFSLLFVLFWSNGELTRFSLLLLIHYFSSMQSGKVTQCSHLPRGRTKAGASSSVAPDQTRRPHPTRFRGSRFSTA